MWFGIFACWHMFEEKREAIMAVEAAVLPLHAYRYPVLDSAIS